LSTIRSYLLPKYWYTLAGGYVEAMQRSLVFPNNFGTKIALDNQSIHLPPIRKKKLMTLMRLIHHLDRERQLSNGRGAEVEKKVGAQFHQLLRPDSSPYQLYSMRLLRNRFRDFSPWYSNQYELD
jgi:hypothetical protein